MIKNRRNDKIESSVYTECQARIEWSTKKGVVHVQGFLVNTDSGKNEAEAKPIVTVQITNDHFGLVLADLNRKLVINPNDFNRWKPALEDLERKLSSLVFSL